MLKISKNETAGPAIEPKKPSRLWNIVVSFSLASFAMCSVAVSAVLSWHWIDGDWFQRSGSLCVLFCVLLEIHQASLRSPVPSDGVTVNGRPTMLEPDVSTLDVGFHWFAWAGIVVGTFVWGYGDLVL